MIDLVINWKCTGALPSVYACWQPLQDAYKALPDDYASTLHWKLRRQSDGAFMEGGDEEQGDMSAGIWYAVAKDAYAFDLYMKIGGWVDRYADVPAQLDYLLEYGSNYD